MTKSAFVICLIVSASTLQYPVWSWFLNEDRFSPRAHACTHAQHKHTRTNTHTNTHAHTRMYACMHAHAPHARTHTHIYDIFHRYSMVLLRHQHHPFRTPLGTFQDTSCVKGVFSSIRFTLQTKRFGSSCLHFTTHLILIRSVFIKCERGKSKPVCKK